MPHQDDVSHTVKQPHWRLKADDLAAAIVSFVFEFGSFTPELFAEMKFHLLRGSSLTKEGRDELCEVAISHGLCPKCDLLYVAKQCPLWYNLYKIVRWRMIERGPPCIRLAFVRRKITTVTDYLVAVNLIAPLFYPEHPAPSCRSMQKWDLCRPNLYCQAMRTTSTLEYISARESVKLSRTFALDEN